MERRDRACRDPTAFDLTEVPIFALRKIVEKEIERSNPSPIQKKEKSSLPVLELETSERIM
jgi:hypothetical protein